ncbi:hypothetical protein HPB48_023175 [Haemaphysalis longicornis]|uniref:BESS domain-containing protein n=1 Tax=Haemaphysalis longicornis TaxID=44386 RepID=A0A9J6H5M7_HAELO|nr:hypothetical protein HPB48_023175 [Haemaphysalis longicornis]
MGTRRARPTAREIKPWPGLVRPLSPTDRHPVPPTMPGRSRVDVTTRLQAATVKRKRTERVRGEQLGNRSRRESRYDCDDGDDYQTDTAATGYCDDALVSEDDNVPAVAAMLRAASANWTTSCKRPHIDTDDCDTLYLLSLRDSFKRLSASQKSIAMTRIPALLHEIEFGKS